MSRRGTLDSKSREVKVVLLGDTGEWGIRYSTDSAVPYSALTK